MRRLTVFIILMTATCVLYAANAGLYLKSGFVDTSGSVKARAVAGPYWVANVPLSEKHMYIIQFNKRIDGEVKDLLVQHNMVIADYIPDNAFLVWTSGKELNALNSPCIQWKGIFQPAYRVDQRLKAMKAGAVKIRLSMYPFADTRSCRFMLADLGGVVEKSDTSSWQQTFIARVSVDAIPTLASLPGIKWIEPFIAPELHAIVTDLSVSKKGSRLKNQAASNIMNTSSMWAAGYTGSGQIAAVCDTGLDVGNIESIHRDFFVDTNSDGLNDKIVAAYALGRTNDWSDSDGIVLIIPQVKLDHAPTVTCIPVSSDAELMAVSDRRNLALNHVRLRGLFI